MFDVTPGHVFVMGDHLVGRVDVVLGSWDLGIAHDPIWTWPSGLRLSRFFSWVN